MSDSATVWTAAHQASLSFTVSRGLLKFVSTESVMPSNHLILCLQSFPFSSFSFSSRPQSFPASGSFQMSQFFTSGGLGIGASASASVLPMNIQDWFPLELTGLSSLQSKGLSRVFSNTTVQNIYSYILSFLYTPNLTSIHDWKKQDWLYGPLSAKQCLCF